MEKVRETVDRVLEWALIVLMGANVINVLWQVFTRFVLRNPSSYTEELARYLLIWVGLLGASYAVGKRLHLAIDYFTAKTGGMTKQLIEMFIDLCVFFFAFFVMVLGGIRLVNITLTLNQVSAALQMKVGHVYLVVPLSGALIMFYSLVLFYERLQLVTGKKTVVTEEHQTAVLD